MSFVFALFFSVIWGSVIWLAFSAVARTRFVACCSPSVLLTAIAATIVPSGLLLTGWSVVLPPMEPTAFIGDQAGRELREFATATVDTISRKTDGNGLAWIPGAILSIYAAGLALFVAKAVRTFRLLRSIAGGAKPLRVHRGRWPVVTTERNITPFALGGWRPVIVLPDNLVDSAAPSRIAMIIAHEEVHLRHRDPDVATFLAVVATLFWFNPFLTSLIAQWRFACELRADAMALQDATASARKDYAQALISALRATAGALDPHHSTSFVSRSIRSEKMRISAVLNGFAFGRGPARLVGHAIVWLLLITGSAAALTSVSADLTLDKVIPGGKVSSPFGVKRVKLRRHTGVDVRAALRTPIAAPADAVVLQATDLFRSEPRWGKAVVLQFGDDLEVWFTHLDTYYVKPGDRVKKGTFFATVGNTGQSTGPHVHIEMYKDRVRVDPATVWRFLKK